MNYVAIYDVTDSKLRRAFFVLLSSYGVAVQKSVFECCLSSKQKDKLLSEVQALVDKGTCRFSLVRVYPKHKATMIMGKDKISAFTDVLYVG